MPRLDASFCSRSYWSASGKRLSVKSLDALSDRIIVVDRGSIVAQGTADELKERTGGTVCEIVPLDPADVNAVAAALDHDAHRFGRVARGVAKGCNRSDTRRHNR